MSLVFSSFMSSVNCPSVDIVIPRYLYLSLPCILPAFTVSFISSSFSLPVSAIVYFVSFRPKFIFFYFVIIAQLFIDFLMCSAVPAVAMSSINTDILIFCLTISIFHFFSHIVNSECFCTPNDGYKYPALFYHFFNRYIFSVSYWYLFLCLFHIKLLMCLDHSLNYTFLIDSRLTIVYRSIKHHMQSTCMC